MFKKRTKRANVRKPTSATDTGAEEDEQFAVMKKTSNKRTHSTFSTNSSTTTEPKSKQLVTTSFESSREQTPHQYGGGATAELQTETEKDKDARALHEKNVAFNEDDPGNAEGVYSGITNQVNRIQKTKEQVAMGKVTGTMGPIRAPTNVRSSSRFDYQPDVCKDYKETGVCGFGDSCKFMHDRSDYKSGWQLEREWDEKEKARKERIARGEADTEDGDGAAERSKEEELPFACHLCRQAFTNPIVTNCGHYFCQKCALERYRKTSRCAICGENTKGMFNRATKLIEALKTRHESG